jgi:multiple antibiotic resistance protein
MDWDLVRGFFLAMVAITNPLNKIPLWMVGSRGMSPPGRFRLAILVIASAAIVLFLFLLGGPVFLRFFGIDLASFRIAGGIIILIVGLDMLRGRAVQVEPDATPDGEDASPLVLARARFKQIAVPVAIPFIAGPGSIATVVVFGAAAATVVEYLALSVVLAIIMAIIFLVLLSGPWVERRVGDTTLDIQTRVFGMLLAAIGVQFMAEGLGTLFPTWLGHGSPIRDVVIEGP